MNYMRSGVYVAATAAMLFCSTVTTAQNLVPNPGFEQYITCPEYEGAIQFNTTYPPPAGPDFWINPVEFSTPDHYHTCAGNGTFGTVPLNDRGYQHPHGGQAYAGIITANNGNGAPTSLNYSEYVQCKLLQPLQAGKRYQLSFYLSYAGGDPVLPKNFIALDRYGAHFSQTMVTETQLQYLTLPMHAGSTPGHFITDSAGWTLITAEFTAAGGEEWMVLGTFHDPAAPLQYTHVAPNPPAPGEPLYNYTYLDDISLTEMIDCDTMHRSKDSTVCFANTEVTLNATFAGTDYLWNTGETTASIRVYEPGLYYCTVTEGCHLYSDSFRISTLIPPLPFTLGPDTSFCEDEPALVQPDRVNEGYALQWNTGATSKSLPVNQPGSYVLTQYNSCYSVSDSVSISFYRCSYCLSLPDVFSPNGDGLNDAFRPIIVCDISGYQLSVYDRWGEKVFVSYMPNEGWNGMFRGLPLPAGVYHYLIHYFNPAEQKAHTVKGDISLIR